MTGYCHACGALAASAVVCTGFGPLSAAHAKETMTLVCDGQPAATIVLAKEPTCSAAFAAVELQEHLRRITGADVPVVTDEQTPPGVRILVGESQATRTLGLKGADFKPQEYLIRFLPDALILMGRDKPGPAFAESVAVCGQPQWRAGRFGKALAFNGTGDAVTVQDSGFTDEAGTLEAWVRFTAPANEQGTILRLDGGGPWTYHILQRRATASSTSPTTGRRILGEFARVA